MKRGGWVYMMTERYRGTIYTGVTAYLPERITQHRDGKGAAFTQQYGLTRFVYAEHHDRIEDAIAREKAIKKWRRQWKIDLIEKANPNWNDLYDQIISTTLS
ncbi:MAG: excinuclease ABC subunit C [Novosphingobium sp.]|nr:excinuclease ABC subunit C [Novosphingobium sp.]MBX9642777.1 GIY-YIG nuclease family protein [Novosphingobium sp.]